MMGVFNLPGWFILFAYVIGCAFIFLGYQLLFKKQASLLGLCQTEG